MDRYFLIGIHSTLLPNHPKAEQPLSDETVSTAKEVELAIIRQKGFIQQPKKYQLLNPLKTKFNFLQSKWITRKVSPLSSQISLSGVDCQSGLNFSCFNSSQISAYYQNFKRFKGAESNLYIILLNC
jgi:hypothetical protein